MRLRLLLGTILLAAGIAVAAESVPAKAATDVRHVSHISNINVVPDDNGLKVEISGDHSMSAKVMKLTSPNRIVLDLPDSVLVGRSREIPVNRGEVKDIRAAHYSSAPPTTRVVVDMASMWEFELLPAGNKLVLKLKNPEIAAHPAVPQKETVVQQPPTAATSPELKTVSTKIQDHGVVAPPTDSAGVVILTPPPTPSAAFPEKSEAKKADKTGQAKSDLAAAHFANAQAPQWANANQPLLPASASANAEPAVVNAALQQQATKTVSNTTSSSCTSGHYSGAPLNLDLKDLDIKDFFRLIHEISGLNVVLDPGVKGIVTIDVTDIPWDQALAIVLRNNGLECELEGNVLRIATLETLRAEADARRAQQEAQAMAIPRESFTRYLSYAHSKDVTTILKKFLSPRGDIVSDDRSNAVIIEDIPSTRAKIDALLTQMDRKTPEVQIEARVVSAQRTFARDIGTQLGFGWGNGQTAVGGIPGVPSPIQVTSATPPNFLTVPGTGGSPAGGGTTTQIPLFTNLPAVSPSSGISLTTGTQNYRLDFVLTMAESRGLVKVLSRPRVVTQNNIAALIRQGQRIPVVTLAQLGGPPTVTYIDAFLRLTVTPQITNENTIFLLLDIENTTPDFTHVSGQQLNPTLNTQQTTTQILVSDGQTVVIGGVIQTNNNLAINQVPVLGNIPILGNLFKHTTVQTSTAELLFFITPKIIQT